MQKNFNENTGWNASQMYSCLLNSHYNHTSTCISLGFHARCLKRNILEIKKCELLQERGHTLGSRCCILQGPKCRLRLHHTLNATKVTCTYSTRKQKCPHLSDVKTFIHSGKQELNPEEVLIGLSHCTFCQYSRPTSFTFLSSRTRFF